jgi:hypothetical protein
MAGARAHALLELFERRLHIGGRKCMDLKYLTLGVPATTTTTRRPGPTRGPL